MRRRGGRSGLRWTNPADLIKIPKFLCLAMALIMHSNPVPLVAVTLGDVAGVGPETIVRAALSPQMTQTCRMLAVGSPKVLRRAVELVGQPMGILEIPDPEEANAIIDVGPEHTLLCWNPVGDVADEVPPGFVDARAGEAAYQALVSATRAALEGRVDAITTAPLNKEALHRAGYDFPGHTEILAHECGIRQFAMMLYLPPDETTGGSTGRGSTGLGVAHATLHTSIRSVPDLLTTGRVEETIDLVDRFMKRIGCDEPRIGVCALNPHAGEAGLFGNEESQIIAPAVEAAKKAGISASGPWPADTLMKRAVAGEFDGVAAMYHDQGHIALKLVAFDRVVNVTLGLPIVRTSPSQGTAFDIAWKGRASASGLIAALEVAAKLAKRGERSHPPG